MVLVFSDYLRLGVYLRYAGEREWFLRKYRITHAEH
jgi:hypothetical protein